jgi:hypothetical protein
MFRSKRKTNVEYITPEFYKDWGNANAELDSLGHRLDAVRGIITDLEQRKVPENHWGLRHWREVEAVVLRRWKNTVRLKDTGLRQKQTWDSGPRISYEWFERDDGVGTPVFPFFNFTFLDNWFNQSDLSASWERAQRNRLEMARKGLA